MSKRPLATAAEGLPSLTISQRVNAIFAAYVATEAEQARLGALNTPEADAQADKLGDTALSLAHDLESIISFDANPDLLAARAMHELMLTHPWDKLGSFDWTGDDREALVTVSLVANATTGAVRDQVRRVMRTKGIEIAEAPARPVPDPLLAFVNGWNDALSQFNTVSKEGGTDEAANENWKAHVEPFFDRANAGDVPAATTAEGAAAGLRRVLAWEDGIENQHDETLIRAALAFLDEGQALPSFDSAGPDPMAAVIARHKAWLETYATAPFDGGEEEAAWIASNPDANGDRLHQDPPMPTTRAGALAAIRFVMEDSGYIQKSHAAILGQALAFLDAPALPPPADPLALLIAEYRRAVDISNAAEEGTPEEKAWWKPFNALSVDEPPKPTTLAGVLAAIKLVAHEEEIGRSDMTVGVLKAAAEFLERQVVAIQPDQPDDIARHVVEATAGVRAEVSR